MDLHSSGVMLCHMVCRLLLNPPTSLLSPHFAIGTMLKHGLMVWYGEQQARSGTLLGRPPKEKEFEYIVYHGMCFLSYRVSRTTRLILQFEEI